MFRCIDRNGDNCEHTLMGSQAFCQKIIRKLTASRICNVNDYIKYTENGVDFANLLKQQQKIKIVENCCISIIRRKNSRGGFGSENLVLQIDLPKQK